MSVSGPHDLPIDHMPETRTHKRCRCLRMDHTSAAHTRAPGPPKRPGLQPEAHMSERPTHMSDGTPPATHMKTQKPTQANVLLPAPHTSERVPKGGWVIKQPGGRRDPNGPCLVSYLAWSSTWPTPPPSSRGPGMQTSNADRRIWVWSTEQDPEEGRSGQGQECQGGPGVAWSA